MKDIGFNFGVSARDTLLQYTTVRTGSLDWLCYRLRYLCVQTGWMMWNLMVAGLAWGARLVLYDGSPLHPSVSSFLRMVNDQG